MLAVSRLFGEVVRRGGLPSLIGELLAGMLLGASVLNIIQPTSDLTTVSNISLFLVMFLTGLNLHTKDILAVGRKAVLLSLPGFILPFVAGTAGAAYYGLAYREALAVGLTIAITAVPVNSIILMDLGIMKTKLGNTVLTAGVIDDQMSLVTLGIILQLPAGGGGTVDYLGVVLSIVTVLLFVGGVFLVDWMLRKNPGWMRAVVPRLKSAVRTREAGMALLLIFGIGVSLLAEQLGLHFIIGAYFAGLLLNQAIGDESLAKSVGTLSGVTFGLFAPLLFAFIGIQLDPEAIANVYQLFLLLLAVGIVGKMIGGYLGARLGGFSHPDSKIIGSLMNSRGMVELVIASTVYEAGVISLTVYSVVVAIGIITTTMSAILSKATLGKRVPE